MAVKTRAQIQAESNTTYIDNTVGSITPDKVRTLNDNWTDSTVFLSDTGSLTVASASVAISSSYALSASHAGASNSSISASYALTASFIAGNVESASYALSASFATQARSASFATTASYVLNAVSASFAGTASIARNLVVKARNGSASTLVRGTVVHITSAVGDNPVFTTASFSTEALSSNTLGVLAADATSGTDVDVVVNGIVTGVDTDPGSGYVAGDIIYLSSSGQFTKVQPQAPDQVVVVGQVLRAQQNNGSIYVNISNGWELEELHNVRITSVSYGDLLVNSGSLWINSKQLSGSYGLTGSLSATSFTGSLQGTSSFALTASFLQGTIASASYALSASHADNANTASYVQNAQSASFVQNAQSASYVLNAVSASQANNAITASYVKNAESASYVLNAVSSSYANEALSSSYSVTASHALKLQDNIVITASNALVTNNLVVQGTASFAYTETVTGSAVIIGEQFIVLNANPPAARYAGIQVYDSASFNTASFEWDGDNDNWIVVEETGLSAGIITGPTGSKGSEVFPSLNRIVKGSGHHTISDSNISDNGSVVSINSNSEVTGSLIVSNGITGSLEGTASYALQALSASYAPSVATFPYSGSAVITGSLEITRPELTQPFQLSLVSGSNIYFEVRNNGTNNINNVRQFISESAYSQSTTNLRGGNIINVNGTTTSSGSVIISGSRNIINSALATNAQKIAGDIVGINGDRNIVNFFPRVTGSAATKTLPVFALNTLNAAFVVNDRIGLTTGTSISQLSNNNLQSNTTINNNSGSRFTFNNNTVQSILTVTNNWSGSTLNITNNSFLGATQLISTPIFATPATGTNSITLTSNHLALNNGTIIIPSGSNGSTGLNAVIAHGFFLNITGSNQGGTSNGAGAAFFGRYNAIDGISNNVDHSVFAVGTGTNVPEFYRTSLWVSASGVTLVNDGLIVSSSLQVTGSANFDSGITGSLLGTASYANVSLSSSYAESSSFASNAATASFVVLAQSASYVLNAVSASYSLSGSHADRSTSASYSDFALSSSYSDSALSSSYALTASFYAGTVNTASFANTASFINPLNQAVVITGSVQGNVVSASISSNTSSLDFSLGNFFTSAVSASTFFNITNVKPGQTVNVLLTTVGTGSATFSTNVKQPSGSAYVPTVGSDKKDVLTFASWDSSNVYLVSVKNLI